MKRVEVRAAVERAELMVALMVAVRAVVERAAVRATVERVAVRALLSTPLLEDDVVARAVRGDAVPTQTLAPRSGSPHHGEPPTAEKGRPVVCDLRCLLQLLMSDCSVHPHLGLRHTHKANVTRVMISISKCDAISNLRRRHDGLDRIERIIDIKGGDVEGDATVGPATH